MTDSDLVLFVNFGANPQPRQERFENFSVIHRLLRSANEFLSRSFQPGIASYCLTRSRGTAANSNLGGTRRERRQFISPRSLGAKFDAQLSLRMLRCAACWKCSAPDISTQACFDCSKTERMGAG